MTIFKSFSEIGPNEQVWGLRGRRGVSTAMAESWAERVKGMRAGVGLNQHRFAGLLGFTVTSVNRWENGVAVPSGLSVLVLDLLSCVLPLHPRRVLLDALRRAGGEPAALVRVLVWLELHPSIPQPPGPPPSESQPPL